MSSRRARKRKRHGRLVLRTYTRRQKRERAGLRARYGKEAERIWRNWAAVWGIS